MANGVMPFEYTPAFVRVIDEVLPLEGGYSEDPLDPGGETNFGITRSFAIDMGSPLIDLKTLQRPQAKAIYYVLWSRLRLETFPYVLQFQVMDFAVNSGGGTAIRYLQICLHLADDGRWGPISAARLAAFPPEHYPSLAINYIAGRLSYMTRCSAWEHDGRGWANRIAQDLTQLAVDLGGQG